ncbi:hypothetical protein NP233_g722 [Leucocoprinus birnbaumii]|uniref:Uncharacterized protein n=1 Tax=Leucocoprinus birnbaumii TaxID=56174 RepID=A0AAD5Z027_9AGAR|nr:hypothetical protein NP233_g722 [Leucocoprinus birnbaumii]
MADALEDDFVPDETTILSDNDQGLVLDDATYLSEQEESAPPPTASAKKRKRREKEKGKTCKETEARRGGRASSRLGRRPGPKRACKISLGDAGQSVSRAFRLGIERLGNSWYAPAHSVILLRQPNRASQTPQSLIPPPGPGPGPLINSSPSSPKFYLRYTNDALLVSQLTHIILDVSYIDTKKRSLLDIPETRDEVFKTVLGAPQVLKAIKEGQIQVVLF